MADKIDNQIEYYGCIAKKYGITSSVWSMFDIADLEAPVPFVINKITYERHWGKHTIVIGDDHTPLPSIQTWVDMWKACDMAIRFSGDQHHIFIERLSHLGDGAYELDTGS